MRSTRELTNPTHTRRRIALAFGCLFAIGAVVAAPQAARAQAPSGVDEEADQILHKMSDYLGALQSFSFTGKSTLEVVTKERQKLSFPATSKVDVKRPNKLRSDRLGAVADLSLYYDGSKIALHGHRMNLYAIADAPKTLDGAIDFARDKLGLDAPAADLLYEDSYSALTEDVVGGMVVGKEFIDGVPVHHLAFQGREVDFQLWIEDGPRPLPRRYVITSKKVTGSPDFEIELSDWDVSADPSNDRFKFVRPAGAERIEFLGVREAKESSKEAVRRKP